MMESEDISDNQVSICIHCCGPLCSSNNENDNNNRFQDSYPSLSNSTYDVTKALSSIFKLNYLKPFDSLEWLHKEDDQLTLLCINCKVVLADLYHVYQDFLQLGQIDSFLSKKLDKLDEIIDCHERQSINCDLITISRPEARQEKETLDNSSIPLSTLPTDREICPKEVSILLTRLPESEFTSTTTATSPEDEEKEFNDSPPDQVIDDYNPDWLQVKIEEDDDDEFEAPEIKIKDLQDIMESDDDAEMSLKSSSRRSRRKQDLSSSGIAESSLSRNNTPKTKDQDKPSHHNNKDNLDEGQTLTYASHGFKNWENSEQKRLKSYSGINRPIKILRSSKIVASMTGSSPNDMNPNLGTFVVSHHNNSNNERFDERKTVDSNDFEYSTEDKSPRETDEECEEDSKDPSADDVHDERRKLITMKNSPTSSSSSTANQLSCQVCKLLMPSTSDLANHLFVAHAPIGSTCPVCKLVLNRRGYLKDHLCVHAGHKPMHCPGSNCNMSFLKWTQLRIHFAMSHRGETLDEDRLREQTRPRVEVIDLTKFVGNRSSSSTLNELSQISAVAAEPVTTSSVDIEDDDDDEGNNIKFQTLHCPKCSKKFLYLKNLQAHQKICHVKNKKEKRKRVEEEEHSTALLKCPLCTTEFVDKFKLSAHLWQTHVQTNQEGRKTDCPLCEKKYPTDPSKLEAHILYTHATAAEGEHECSTCGKKFYRACNLSRHITTHQKTREAKSYVCKVCSKNFSTMTQLDIHMRRHNKDFRFPCPFPGCGKGFVVSKELENHQLMAHLEEGQEKPYTCTICAKGFISRYLLKSHEKIHMDRPFSCTQCNRRFVFESEQLKHQEKCKGRQRFQCHICEKNYATDQCLRAHLRFHAGEAMECTVPGCDKKFYAKNTLEAHVKSHKKILKCPDLSCGKCFGQAINLTNHLRALHPHLVPEKDLAAPQLCPICGVSILGNSRLKKHVRSHSEERPHQCPLCEKRFKTVTVLRHHLRIHSQDRAYPCTFDGCSKSFYTAQHLEKHTRVHTGEKSYLCPECGKAFRLSENLNKHMLIHSDERKFQCQLCDKAFKQPQSLKTHQATHAK